ncbi:MAG: class I SAM-dependent methyltransferase, partial [Candidatus Eisenbacteria bacterium]|nr:class I SAM-dependent methyltransferase [Candidatus Eisenbacteria bacterium]
MPLWFDDAFGAWYLKVYPHRDKVEAQQALEFVLPRLNDPILDIGCGTGRHLRTLAELNRHAFGVDRSEDLLREGAREKPSILTARSDMRQLPFASASFGSVLSMFTSFGYFDSHQEHVNLLKEWRRVTLPGGRLILDYLNPPFVTAGLKKTSERELEDGARVLEHRRIRKDLDPSRVEKKVTLQQPNGEELTSYT